MLCIEGRIMQDMISTEQEEAWPACGILEVHLNCICYFPYHCVNISDNIQP